ncbi:hypothetical protein LTS18_012050 [Coniosporium uncinatum]|uniref:Uncharacterized protein n=1 Tax=Coniosporium uncinatum TaxID=93489 RepID=A0ACC3CXX5_9PEZI|nr:hypothetical protein LTS18_012050 [Coniosporium uncinatum]
MAPQMSDTPPSTPLPNGEGITQSKLPNQKAKRTQPPISESHLPTPAYAPAEGKLALRLSSKPELNADSYTPTHAPSMRSTSSNIPFSVAPRHRYPTPTPTPNEWMPWRSSPHSTTTIATSIPGTRAADWISPQQQQQQQQHYTPSRNLKLEQSMYAIEERIQYLEVAIVQRMALMYHRREHIVGKEKRLIDPEGEGVKAEGRIDEIAAAD